MTQTRLDRAWLDSQIARMIDEGDMPDPDDSLILYGLDSIRVMEFIGQLRKYGLDANFEELTGKPTANAWWALIRARLGVAEVG